MLIEDAYPHHDPDYSCPFTPNGLFCVSEAHHELSLELYRNSDFPVQADQAVLATESLTRKCSLTGYSLMDPEAPRDTDRLWCPSIESIVACRLKGKMP